LAYKMSGKGLATIADSVIDILNCLRAGKVPETLLDLLTEMANNCGEGAVVLPERMKKLCCNSACVEEALQLVKNNKPATDIPRKPLANSMPLTSIHVISAIIYTRRVSSTSMRIWQCPLSANIWLLAIML